jgi:hypothetical protein
MKKFKTTLLAIILVQSVFAQYDNTRSDLNNVFKINPFSLVVGNFTFFYERKVSDASTLQLGFNFMPQPITTFGASFSCFGITPEYRIYLSHNFIDLPGGGYIAPFTRYRCLTMALPEQYAKYWNGTIKDDQFAAGIVLGYQYITPSTISFDFFAGPFYNSNNINLPIKIPMNNDLGFLGNNGPGFRVGAAVGFAF